MPNQNIVNKLWKVHFNPSGNADGREFVISQGEYTRLKGDFKWEKLVAGQGKDGKILFFRYYNYEMSKIELFNIIGADEYSQIIELSWPEESSEQAVPGFICPCGKVTDVLFWHPKLNAWFCSYPHKDYKIKVYKPTARAKKYNR